MCYADKIIDIKLKIIQEAGILCADNFLTVANKMLQDWKTLTLYY